MNLLGKKRFIESNRACLPYQNNNHFLVLTTARMAKLVRRYTSNVAILSSTLSASNCFFHFLILVLDEIGIEWSSLISWHYF